MSLSIQGEFASPLAAPYPAGVRALALVFLAAAPLSAEAGDGESALETTLDFALLTADGSNQLGGGGELAWSRGVTEATWLRIAAAGVRTEDVTLAQATVGLRYAFDVVHYVPYIELSAGGGTVEFDDFRPVAEAGFGIDRLLSRSWSLGLHTRFALYVPDAGVFRAGFALTYRWGFF